MDNKSERITLIIVTICIALIDLTHLLDYITTGDPGGIVSNLCFLAGTICLVIGWIQYFRKKKES